MIRAFVDGLRRVWRAPWVLVGMSFWLVAAAIPVSWLPTRLGVVPGGLGFFDLEWLNLLRLPAGWSAEFAWFAGSRLVLAAADGPVFPATLVQIAAFHITVELFLDGGVLDRLARDRRLGASGFFAACGGYFGRIARLGLIAVPVYSLVFVAAPPPVAIAIALLLNPLFGYARVRAVVEDRRSALASLGAAVRFVRRHPVDVFGLYAMNALLFWLAARAHGGLLASTEPPPSVLFGVFALVSAAIRLQFAASQAALFQSHLAHAGYTAAPPPRWPDSPSAEAIRLMD